MRISERKTWVLAVIAIILVVAPILHMASHWMITKYTLTVDRDEYWIKDVTERSEGHIRAIRTNGIPIEAHGHYVLIGPLGDKR